MPGTDFWIYGAIVAVLSYLAGSLNFGIIVSRLYANDDVRKHGSGNAGMSNVLRTYGKLPAVMTAAGDFLKAVIVVLGSRAIFAQAGLNIYTAGYIAGLFALLGHLFPVYFGFRGGKGVLTALGVICIVNPLVFAILCLVCIPLVFITRITSVGSITGAAAFPILTLVLGIISEGSPDVPQTICAFVTGIIILYVHRQNIRRLINGTENRYGKPKK